MQRKFLKPSHPRLTQISKEVPENRISSPQMVKTVKEMLEVIKQERKGHKKGVGLAAPQIGILKRMILVDVAADGKNKPKNKSNLKVYINPEITWKSKREGEWYEGCFSTGNVCGIVSRSTSIKIRAFVITPPRYDIVKTLGANRNPPPRWDVVEEKWSGYVARIFQHEIDHLDGKFFVDHIKDPDKLHWVEENEFQAYRKSWKTWTKKCPFSKWKKIKKPL